VPWAAARKRALVLSASCRRDHRQGRRHWRVYRRAKAILKEILADPDRWRYGDLSIAPPQDDEFDSLDLYQRTNGGEAALARRRREDTLRAKAY
jgi:hypothetical protein